MHLSYSSTLFLKFTPLLAFLTQQNTFSMPYLSHSFMITPKTIFFQNIGQASSQSQLFSQEPVILCHGQDFINPTIIMDNLTKQLQDPQTQCFLVVDIISQNQRPKSVIELEMVKISELIPFKRLLHLPIDPKENLGVCLEKLDICEVIKKHKSSEHQMDVDQKPSYEGNNFVNNKKFGSFSLRLFPFHKTFNKIISYLPSIIKPLAQHDILSYQKVKKLSTYQYILALPHYSQKLKPQLETVLFLNWGSEIVEFSLFPQAQRQVAKIKLQPLQIIIIPPGYSCKWKSSQTSLTKLLTWKLVPKQSLPELLSNLQNQTIKSKCPYAINQVLIDYCFHQFGLIEAKNQDFMYGIANYINKQFHKEFDILNTELQVKQTDITSYGPNNKKLDECEHCGSQIINYFAVYKNLVYCVNCAKQENKINKIYHKISSKVFQLGCELLYNVYRFKSDKQAQNQNVQVIMNNAVFFQFQDTCDGDFVGSYNSAHCKIHQTIYKKQHNSRLTILQNTIRHLKSNIGISSTLQILSKYSRMKYTNNVEKELYQQILVRTSNFTKQEEEKEWLKIMMPEYKEDDLKLFAIQLCIKEKFDRNDSTITY